MARVSGTAVIMISSPSSDTGHIFNAVMNAFYDDGRPKFLIVNMSICKECRIEGIYDSTKCSHDLQPPEWHGKEQEKDLLRLYEGDEEVAKREFGGKITASDDSVFHEEFVSAFKEQEFYDDHGYTYKVAFTAFDPAGGGGGSDQAIITVGFCGGIATILGLDARVRTGGQFDQEQFITSHINNVRKKFGNVHIVFIPENNLSMDGELAGSYVQYNMRNTTVMEETSKGNDKKYGVIKKAGDDRVMAAYITHYLSTGTLAIHQHFRSSTFKNDKEKARNIFVGQMRGFKEHARMPLSVHGNTSYKLAGRKDGKKEGKDDCIIVLGMALRWSHTFAADAKYASIRQLYGRR